MLGHCSPGPDSDTSPMIRGQVQVQPVHPNLVPERAELQGHSCDERTSDSQQSSSSLYTFLKCARVCHSSTTDAPLRRSDQRSEMCVAAAWITRTKRIISAAPGSPTPRAAPIAPYIFLTK